MTIVIIAPFLPVSVVKARVPDATIEWLVNEPNYKEAKVHILTHNESYTLLIKANISIVGSETYVNITARFNPQGKSSWMFVAVPDTITDAPYALGQPVSAFHIEFPSWFASGLAVVMAIVLIFGIFFFFETLLTQIASDLTSLLGKNFMFWASIPWVYLSIYGRDRNDDGSIAFDVPYDETNLSFARTGGFIYVATSMSWWRIEERHWGWWIFSVTYYAAVWIEERMSTPPTLVSPWAWFEWTPAIPVVGQQVAFVSTSFDPDGSLVSSHWMFGDGIKAFGRNLTHTYVTAGWHTVSLEVIDNDGLTNSTSVNILVASRVLNITADSLINILVKNPDGHFVGYDSETGDIPLNIVGSFYSGPNSEPQILVIPEPTLGLYEIRMTGTGQGEYILTVQVVGSGGTIVDTKVWSDTTCQGKTDIASFQLNSDGIIIDPTFHVIPEAPLGTIMASVAMIFTILAYVALPKRKRKQAYYHGRI